MDFERLEIVLNGFVDTISSNIDNTDDLDKLIDDTYEILMSGLSDKEKDDFFTIINQLIGMMKAYTDNKTFFASQLGLQKKFNTYFCQKKGILTVKGLLELL